MIWITGDTHGSFGWLERFCREKRTVKEDVMIILGDAGINYFGASRDDVLKRMLSALPITLLCIHGNHEMRPECLYTYELKPWRGGMVWQEELFPSLLFARDGEVYDLDGVAAEMLAYGQEPDPTLLEVDFEDLQYSDPNQDYYSSMMLMTRLALNEGDAFLANKFCAEQMMMQDYYLPLEDYLANGWMEGLDLEPVEYTSQETGETHIAGLRLDNVTALADPLGAYSPGEAVLIITPVSTNLETSMNVIEHMMINLLEGNYAPAESTQQ